MLQTLKPLKTAKKYSICSVDENWVISTSPGRVRPHSARPPHSAKGPVFCLRVSSATPIIWATCKRRAEVHGGTGRSLHPAGRRLPSGCDRERPFYASGSGACRLHGAGADGCGRADENPQVVVEIAKAVNSPNIALSIPHAQNRRAEGPRTFGIFRSPRLTAIRFT
jgi:hypothetical protein